MRKAHNVHTSSELKQCNGELQIDNSQSSLKFLQEDKGARGRLPIARCARDDAILTICPVVPPNLRVPLSISACNHPPNSMTS